jgi:hypothetical protein
MWYSFCVSFVKHIDNLDTVTTDISKKNIFKHSYGYLPLNSYVKLHEIINHDGELSDDIHYVNDIVDTHAISKLFRDSLQYSYYAKQSNHVSKSIFPCQVLHVHSDLLVQTKTILLLQTMVSDAYHDKYHLDTYLEYCFISILLMMYVRDLYIHHLYTGNPTILFTPNEEARTSLHLGICDHDDCHHNDQECDSYLRYYDDISSFFKYEFCDDNTTKPQKCNKFTSSLLKVVDEIISSENNFNMYRRKRLTNFIQPIIDETKTAIEDLNKTFRQLYPVNDLPTRLQLASKRIAVYKEELIAATWHPDRVVQWCLDHEEYKNVKSMFLSS